MKKIILTCEHGGAQIPKLYKKLFRNHAAVLKTHRGLDIGAVNVGREMQKILKVPFDYSLISRLVVDLNRQLDSPTLFSEFTSPLSEDEKEKILKFIYRPHWKKITGRVRELSKKKHPVFHVAVHSMTDRLHGQARTMQLALLYDPRTPYEKKFATAWIRELRQEFPHFQIARNNPYKGAGGGLTGALRQEFSGESYIGIEIEMNQKLLQTFKSLRQQQLFSQSLARSLQRAVEGFDLP